MSFSHPLARQARLWRTGGADGQERPVLVVITTLSLDSAEKGFKPEKLQQLRAAAKEWIDAHPDQAADYLLINRPRDW
jgi:hypothetical protein